MSRAYRHAGRDMPQAGGLYSSGLGLYEQQPQQAAPSPASETSSRLGRPRQQQQQRQQQPQDDYYYGGGGDGGAGEVEEAPEYQRAALDMQVLELLSQQPHVLSPRGQSESRSPFDASWPSLVVGGELSERPEHRTVRARPS